MQVGTATCTGTCSWGSRVQAPNMVRFVTHRGTWARARAACASRKPSVSGQRGEGRWVSLDVVIWLCHAGASGLRDLYHLATNAHSAFDDNA